jgi:hypothetical protein
MTNAIYQLVSPLIEFKALNKMSIQSGDAEIDCIGDLSMTAVKDVSVASKSSRVDVIGKHVTLYSSADMNLSADGIRINGKGSVNISSDRSVSIKAMNSLKTGTVSVLSNNLSHSATTSYVFNSSALATFNMMGAVNKNTEATVVELLTGTETRTITGAFNETITGGKTALIGGTYIETVTESKTINTPSVAMAGLVYTSISSTAATADTPGGAPTVIVPVVKPVS